jgi:hypothetical protein
VASRCGAASPRLATALSGRLIGRHQVGTRSFGRNDRAVPFAPAPGGRGQLIARSEALGSPRAQLGTHSPSRPQKNGHCLSANDALSIGALWNGRGFAANLPARSRLRGRQTPQERALPARECSVAVLRTHAGARL